MAVYVGAADLTDTAHITGLDVALGTKVSSTTITAVVTLTQSAYTALTPKIATTLYVITGP